MNPNSRAPVTVYLLDLTVQLMCVHSLIWTGCMPTEHTEVNLGLFMQYGLPAIG